MPLPSLHEFASKLILLLRYTLSSFREAAQTEILLLSGNARKVLRTCPACGLSPSALRGWGAGVVCLCRPAELCHSPGWQQAALPCCSGSQQLPVLRDVDTQVYSLSGFGLSFQQPSLCISVFSLQPDAYVKFKIMNVKSVKFSWQVKVKFSPAQKG